MTLVKFREYSKPFTKITVKKWLRKPKVSVKPRHYVVKDVDISTHLYMQEQEKVEKFTAHMSRLSYVLQKRKHLTSK